MIFFLYISFTIFDYHHFYVPILFFFFFFASNIAIRAMLSFIRIIRTGAFLWKFFVHFFCLELFQAKFFFDSLSRWLQHSVRYVIPHVPILFSGFAPFVSEFT